MSAIQNYCMRFWLAALLLVDAGCFSTDKVWHGSLSFSESERAQIGQGAGFLSYMTGASLVILWDDEVNANRSIVKESLDPGTIGLTTTFAGGKQKIAFDPSLRVYKMASVAAHEFGHSIGMDHVSEGVMSASAPNCIQWSPEDEAECKRAGWCR